MCTGEITKKVLITTGLERKALAVALSLHRKGISVTVGDSSRLAPAFWSRYCHRRLLYPSPRFDPDGFVDALLNELKERKYDLLFPLGDYEVFAISKNKEKFRKLTNVCLPDFSVVARTIDKAEVTKLAMENNIPCPKTYFIRDLGELEKIKEVIEYPILIKPRSASGSRGIVHIKSKEKFILEYKRIHESYPYPLVQEYIPSNEYGYATTCILDSEYRPITAFCYKRLREFPAYGGASTMVESVKSPVQQEYAIKILQALKWYGPAMVEFRRDSRDGRLKFIEVNGRPNASMKLAMLSGIDIPYLVFRMAADNEKLEPIFDYRSGIRCRWLLPADILHFITNPKRLSLEPSFFKFFDKNTYYEFLSINDPLPVLAWCIWMAKGLFSRSVWADFLLRRYSKRR